MKQLQIFALMYLQNLCLLQTFPSVEGWDGIYWMPHTSRDWGNWWYLVRLWQPCKYRILCAFLWERVHSFSHNPKRPYGPEEAKFYWMKIYSLVPIRALPVVCLACLHVLACLYVPLCTPAMPAHFPLPNVQMLVSWKSLPWLSQVWLDRCLFFGPRSPCPSLCSACNILLPPTPSWRTPSVPVWVRAPLLHRKTAVSIPAPRVWVNWSLSILPWYPQHSSYYSNYTIALSLFLNLCDSLH